MPATRWEKISGASESTFYRAVKALYDKGFVDRDRDGRGACYTDSEKGQELLTVITPSHCQLLS